MAPRRLSSSDVPVESFSLWLVSSIKTSRDSSDNSVMRTSRLRWGCLFCFLAWLPSCCFYFLCWEGRHNPSKEDLPLTFLPAPWGRELKVNLGFSILSKFWRFEGSARPGAMEYDLVGVGGLFNRGVVDESDRLGGSRRLLIERGRSYLKPEFNVAWFSMAGLFCSRCLYGACSGISCISCSSSHLSKLANDNWISFDESRAILKFSSGSYAWSIASGGSDRQEIFRSSVPKNHLTGLNMRVMHEPVSSPLALKVQSVTTIENHLDKLHGMQMSEITITILNLLILSI